MHPSHSIRLPLAGAALALAGLALAAPTARAQSIGYALVPEAYRLESEDLALDDNWLFGGRFALLFGRQVELQPFYFTRSRLRFDNTRAPGLYGPRLAGNDVALRHAGASLQLNIGSGDVTPFVRASGGILRFEPDSGPRRDRIAVSGGGGLKFGFGGVNAMVYAEQLGFRFNTRSLFGSDTGRAATQRSTIYGAAITIPISELPDDEDLNGLRGSSAPLEPFVGQMRFAKSLGLERQELAGVRAGVDFSPMFGLRGYYWRGVNEDRDGTDPIASYGGEAQFNLNAGPGISPFLVAGAGRLDFLDSYRDPAGRRRNDETALILGGGLGFRLGDRLRLNAAVRDYVLSETDDLAGATRTDDLVHNRLYTAGFTFSLGGSTGPTEAERRRERELRTLREERAREDERRERELRMLREERRRDEELDERRRRQDDLLEERRAMQPRDRDERPAERRERLDRERWEREREELREELEALRRERDAMRREMMRRERTDTVVTSPPMPGQSGMDAAQLERRLAELERRLSERINEANRPAPTVVQPPTTTTIVMPRDTIVDARVRGVPVMQRFGMATSRDLRPYAGFSGGDGDAQIVASLRADLGPVRPEGDLRFVPEFALGFGGGGTSVLAMANVQYPFGALAGARAIRPYVTAGAGIFTPSLLGVNTAVGGTFDLRGGRGNPLYGYLELQGINLFDHTRVLFGLSSRR